MTVEDINKVTFERSVRGYKMQEVDEFLVKIAREFDALILERDTALAEKDAANAEISRQHESSEQKLYILAEKIEQYRGDEENLKSALLNAQRLGESIVQEANQKAEAIMKEANQKASKIYDDIKILQATEEKRLFMMRSDVSKFRADILNMYKKHIEQLNSLPAMEEKKVEQMSFVKETIPPAVNEDVSEQGKKTAEKTADADHQENAEISSFVGAEPSPVRMPENPLPSSTSNVHSVEKAQSARSYDKKKAQQDANGSELPKQEAFEDYSGIKFD